MKFPDASSDSLNTLESCTTSSQMRSIAEVRPSNVSPSGKSFNDIWEFGSVFFFKTPQHSSTTFFGWQDWGSPPQQNEASAFFLSSHGVLCLSGAPSENSARGGGTRMPFEVSCDDPSKP